MIETDGEKMDGLIIDIFPESFGLAPEEIVLDCGQLNDRCECRRVRISRPAPDQHNRELYGPQRKSNSAEFKARVAIAAIRGQETINEIAPRYDVHPNLVSLWKKQAQEELPGAFADGGFCHRLRNRNVPRQLLCAGERL